MKFSKTNTRMPSLRTRCPIAAAASFTEDENVSELARKMGKNPKTMIMKLSNDVDSHQLTLAEAVALTELTNDNRIIRAWANGRGMTLFEKAKVGITDDEFSDLLLKQQKANGELATVIFQARQDGVITEGEYAGIHEHILSCIESLLHLDEEIKSQVRDWGEPLDD